MNLMQNLMERIRPIVGMKSWDYCVLWKLSDDQSFLEWMGCCCAGTENLNNDPEELPFSVSSSLPCRDGNLQHSRTKPCDLLAQLPSTIPLDSGIHAQTFISNQVRWLNFSGNSDSNVSEETIGTRVLVSMPFGLIELFVAKQVPEDQQVIDFITDQCSYSMIQENPFPGEGNYQADDHNILQPPILSPATQEKQDLSYEMCVDQIRSPMNFLQQFNGNMFFEDGHESSDPIKTGSMGNGYREMDQMMNNVGMQMMEPFSNKEEQGYNDGYKHDIVRSNSISDSDGNDDEDDVKCRRRTGKGPQSKNLMAERKRRKKLNDRLYDLRSLVPKITKLDRASILGDAIEYVKELKKQVEDLQNELEEQSGDEGARSTGTDENQNIFQPDAVNLCGGPKNENEFFPNKCHLEQDNMNHKVQQMEPQVEVCQLDGNEFFVKAFCEYKAGGFVRLMEALNSLGLEITNVNSTRHTCLVSNIFKVEIRDSEMVQADLVRDSLLELTRNSYRGWPEMAKTSSNGQNGTDHHHLHHHQMY